MSLKIFSLFSAFFILCLAPSASAQIQKIDSKTVESKNNSKKFEPFTGRVNGNKVRLRAQPDLEGKVIREVNKGDLFIVQGEENGFFAVQPPKGTKGYIFRTYVLDNVIEGTRVNVRLEPDVESPIIGKLSRGDAIQGVTSGINPKWLEIDPPSSSRFYIAKDYVTSIGKPEVFESYFRRKNEVQLLLDSAYVAGQMELRKPVFEEIQIVSVTDQFKNVIDNYTDYPDEVAKAKEGFALVQEMYIQRKLAYLESRTEQSAASWEAKRIAMDAELETYQKRLAELEQRLKEERENNFGFTEEPVIVVVPIETKTEPALNLAKEDRETPIAAGAKNNPAPQMNANMRAWQFKEEALYRQWLAQNPNHTMADFYQAEQAQTVLLTGVVEPYTIPSKKRPGDYTLKVNNVPVAYLYSTKIDLQEKVGQLVKVTGVPRPNNHFAYPAFFVISVN